MKYLWTALLVLAGLTFAGPAFADEDEEDIFKGRLFPVELVLEHRRELELTKAQSAEIREAVVNLQTSVPNLEWDLQEAYLDVLARLDERPIDEDAVMTPLRAALTAENEVKVQQLMMLIRIRNLLSDEQAALLRGKMGYE